MSLPFPQPNDRSGDPPFHFSWRFWMIVLLTGVGTGLAASALMLILHAVQHACFAYHTGDFQSGVEHATRLRRVLVVSLAGVVATLGIGLLKYTPGGTAGEIDEAIWFRSGQLAVAKTLAQALLSIVIVAMGASLGREAAPKQSGAALASQLCRWAGLSAAESRLLVACGAGAGMAAVYNVPLGGALFTLEVLLGSLTLPLVLPALATAFTATAVSWLFLPNLPTYAIPSYPTTDMQTVWAVVFGPLAGLASVAFVRLILWAGALKPRRGMGLTLPIFIFIVLGFAAIPFPQLLGNGKGVAQLVFVGQLSLPLLAILVLLKPVATSACLGSGAPGGLFTPSLTVGALLGAFAGHLWAWVWPGTAVGSNALIGAAAFLAASMQAPLAAIALVWELTHHIGTIMVPVLIAVTGATTTARIIDRRSVYSGPLRVRTQNIEGAPGARAVLRHRLSQDFTTLSVAAHYVEVLEHWPTSTQCGRPLYILDRDARLIGRILEADLPHGHPLSSVLAIGAPADLMIPAPSLRPSLSPAEIDARLGAEPTGELPVVDPENGHILGVVRRP